MTGEGPRDGEARPIDRGTSADGDVAASSAAIGSTSPVGARQISDDPSRHPPFTHTRASGFWAAVVIGLVVLFILIIFILENSQRASVAFFGMHGYLPQGVALLLAAAIGGSIVVLAGSARILQLRRRARGHRGLQRTKQATA